ncbi:MAG: hypothetical protein EZS28_005811 [Streblomastix strix]|uniref:Uncharacterized protein n=1 Tax=Streblomastix strix TaxID=222440 RepID=A0A5J4WV42_9EUKA|nr:MAG: hypothetical protein EZS28_005811 [Streblomastix strix]
MKIQLKKVIKKESKMKEQIIVIEEQSDLYQSYRDDIDDEEEDVSDGDTVDTKTVYDLDGSIKEFGAYESG